MGCYLLNFTRKNANKDRSLRDQAAELLQCGLWGIGDRTPHRDSLRPGDQVVAFVGAPEQAFVGHAVLASSVHQWEPAEAERYPGTWTGGVAFSEAEVWPHPVALRTVWDQTSAASNNPNGLFMAGIHAMRCADYDLIAASRGTNVQSVAPTRKETRSRPRPVDPPPYVPSASPLAERLLAEATRLRGFLQAGSTPSFTEAATRATLINKLLEALGYDGFVDLEYDTAVDSGDFADYVLKVGGRRIAVVEAKRLGASFGAREAAEVVRYASVLGVRWGIITDGRTLRLYDPRVPNVTPEKRLVFALDLAEFADREDFLVRLYPELELISKDRIADDTGLERRAAQRAAWELLTSADSATIEALRIELARRNLVHLSQAQLAEMLAEMFG